MHASKPKIGVIGIGFGAQVYIPGLQSEGWEVAASAAATAKRQRRSRRPPASRMCIPTRWS
jgi:hypothetical protein